MEWSGRNPSPRRPLLLLHRGLPLLPSRPGLLLAGLPGIPLSAGYPEFHSRRTPRTPPRTDHTSAGEGVTNGRDAHRTSGVRSHVGLGPRCFRAGDPAFSCERRSGRQGDPTTLPSVPSDSSPLWVHRPLPHSPRARRSTEASWAGGSEERARVRTRLGWDELSGAISAPPRRVSGVVVGLAAAGALLELFLELAGSGHRGKRRVGASDPKLPLGGW